MKLIIQLAILSLTFTAIANDEIVCTNTKKDIVVKSSSYGFDKIRVTTDKNGNYFDLDLQNVHIEKKRLTKTEGGSYLASFKIITKGSVLPLNYNDKSSLRTANSLSFYTKCEKLRS